MLTDAFPFLLPEHVGTSLPERLRSLAGDLERIRLGTGPRPDECTHAPLITDWRTVLSPLGLRLMGSVKDHPILGNCTAMTSQVWAADVDGQWIRTLNRFYRLGAASSTLADRPQSHTDFEGGL
jgi:uncharacterized protein DUF6634